MPRSKPVIVYVYLDEPWLEDTGDKIRIMSIIRALSAAAPIVALVLSRREEPKNRPPLGFIVIPRKLYTAIRRLLGGRLDYDLSPTVKATNYVDELHAAYTVKRLAERLGASTVYAFGSMTLLPFYLRKLLRWRGRIVYDPLSNYAQTLYLNRSLLGKLKLGLYLILHRLSLGASDVIVYPSSIDSDNAKIMYPEIQSKPVVIVDNPPPFCFKSLEEYHELRRLGRGGSRETIFILLAGSRSPINEEAVDLTLSVFTEIEGNYRLYITGPWLDKRKRIPARAKTRIKLPGRLPASQLKLLVASADYGLSPIFRHSAGTFLKTITYLVAGLGVIATPQSIAGVQEWLLRHGSSLFIVRSADEYREAIEAALRMGPLEKPTPVTCDEVAIETRRAVDNIMDIASG